MNPRRALAVLYAAVALDAVGVGLIFPILPRLLMEVTHSADVAPWLGVMTALYALLQFLFAPLLGAWSDQFGRRPVLLISIAGAAVNYLVLAFAPQLWMLLLGRALAGLTSANVSVAMASLTDLSPEETRASRFGVLNSMFGLGFIIGPVLGGLLGESWVRLPFLAAAVLNAANFLLSAFFLPESRPERSVSSRPSLDPFRGLRWVLSRRELVPVTLVFFILSGAGEVYGTCWALWGFDAFGWNGRWIGLSLGAFGVCQVLVQALVPGPATRWLGERGAVLSGLACTSLALAAMAFATEGWIVFAVMPSFALGGIGTPALQARATRQVDGALQGQFQGVLASVTGLASIVAPLGFSSLYFLVQARWPGAIWLSVIATYLLALPLIILGTSSGDRSVIGGPKR